MDLITIENPALLNILIKGYQFDYLQSVFLSAGNTSIYPSITAINQFSNSHRVSSICPAFTGYKLPGSTYAIADNNRLILSSVALLQLSGTHDIIFLNRAGYTKLSDTGFLLSVEGYLPQNIMITIDNNILTTISGDYIVSIQ